MFLVVGVASYVEGGRARRVFGELHTFRWLGPDIRQFSVSPTSCAQRSAFGAPWLIQYLFTKVKNSKLLKSEDLQIGVL